MLMCKSRYFAKCAESIFCSLSLPGWMFLGAGREMEMGLPPSQGGKGEAKCLSFCVRPWAVPRTDVRYFEQVCHPPVLPETAGVGTVTAPWESGSLAKAWLELEVGNTVWFFHESDSSFPLPSATGYQDKWNLWEKGVHGNSGKLGWFWMDCLGLFMFRVAPVPREISLLQPCRR